MIELGRSQTMPPRYSLQVEFEYYVECSEHMLVDASVVLQYVCVCIYKNAYFNDTVHGVPQKRHAHASAIALGHAKPWLHASDVLHVRSDTVVCKI